MIEIFKKEIIEEIKSVSPIEFKEPVEKVRLEQVRRKSEEPNFGKIHFICPTKTIKTDCFWNIDILPEMTHLIIHFKENSRIISVLL